MKHFVTVPVLLAAAAALVAQDPPPKPPTETQEAVRQRVRRDLETRKILNANALDLEALSERSKLHAELPAKPRSTELKIGEDSVYYHTHEIVSNSRKIDNAILLATPPGLRLGWLVDANEYIKTGNATDAGDLSGYQDRVRIVFRQLWPSSAAAEQVPVEMDIEPTVSGMLNAINGTLAKRLKQGKLAMPVQNLQYEFKEAVSKTEMASKIGVSLEASAWGQTLGFDYNKEGEEKSDAKYLYMFLKQDFFTLELQRQNTGRLFVPELDPVDIGSLLGDRRLGVVNQLHFGRFAFVSIRSTTDSKKVKESLNLRFSNQWATLTTDVRNRHEQVLNTVEITYLLHGGSLPKNRRGQSAVAVANVTVEKAVTAIQGFFNRTLVFDENNIPVEIGFAVQDVVTARQIGKNEVNRHTPFANTEPQPFQYRLEYVSASIRDDCGDAEFLVKVVPNGENTRLAIDQHSRGLTAGPKGTYRDYEIGASKGFLSSKRNLRLEVFAGQVDDGRLVGALPQAMKDEWKLAPNRGIDDFHYAIKEFDLADIVRVQAKKGATAYSETFTIISEERRNKYTFKLDVKLPTAPTETAK